MLTPITFGASSILVYSTESRSVNNLLFLNPIPCSAIEGNCAQVNISVNSTTVGWTTSGTTVYNNTVGLTVGVGIASPLSTLTVNKTASSMTAEEYLVQLKTSPPNTASAGHILLLNSSRASNTDGYFFKAVSTTGNEFWIRMDGATNISSNAWVNGRLNVLTDYTSSSNAPILIRGALNSSGGLWPFSFFSAGSDRSLIGLTDGSASNTLLNIPGSATEFRFIVGGDPSDIVGKIVINGSMVFGWNGSSLYGRRGSITISANGSAEGGAKLSLQNLDGTNNGIGAWIIRNTGNSGRFGIIKNNNSGLEVLSILNSGEVGIGTTTPTQKLQVIGDANVSGTVYYGALVANSPHAFLSDSSGRTEICMVAEDGTTVLQTIKNVGGTYQSVYVANSPTCLNKEILEKSYTETTETTKNLEVTETTVKHDFYRKPFTGEVRNTTKISVVKYNVTTEAIA